MFDLDKLNWYAIDPVDLLLMREAKPFSPGDGSWAKGQFPPLPITVFQALRSATERQEGNRTQRQHQFIGPFLLYSPPDEAPTLWLPTPNDMVCVSTRTIKDGESKNDQESETLDETPTRWHRTARFHPLNQTSDLAWQLVGFDPSQFGDNGLIPMVPPRLSADTQAIAHEGDGEAIASTNTATLRRFTPQAGEKERYEAVSGRPPAWIQAKYLADYLNGASIAAPGSSSLTADTPFHDDPWDVQVLPHIKMKSDTRQVKDEEGYFTEVSIRMRPYWQLVAGFSADLTAKVVRLGGEGHRAIITRLDSLPQWDKLQKFLSPESGRQTAYVLTPGLAETAPESEVYSLLPHQWAGKLAGCVGDRPLLWGGMSVFRKTGDTKQEVAFQPQRAFIQPGTVYRFKAGQVPSQQERLLPDANNSNWLKTFETLHYGTLLWGQ
ncbi:MAG: CRISPR-associated protein [Cyanothece sp. SIO2G6]|nr:CRISPR-associated protein [Cyanothece sp. SIO2G6]